MAVTGREASHQYFSLASRKAEEAALRRYQATHWLECLVGPLGIESQPSERKFVSCLRNGLVLCNLINKIEPGSVPKVVVNQASSNPVTWDSQPLPAYQYFENVRNFLVAIEQLKLPAFDASIFERDAVEEGSSVKVVDCILALKAYHEWKQMPGSKGNGFMHRPLRSPFVAHSSSRNINTQLPGPINSDSSSYLENQKLQEQIIKGLVEHMVGTKENMDNNLIASFRDGNMDAAKLLGKFVSTCLEQELQKKFPELKKDISDNNGVRSSPLGHKASTPLEILNPRNRKSCKACLKKGYCKHWALVEMQEKELLSLKELLSTARQEFQELQIQLNSDLEKLGGQVQEMSVSAQKYHKVVQENRNLYNMVQDLKGNIRVYCRIRPVFRAETESVIDFIGKDGSLVVVDPTKLHKDGRKSFQFHQVFGPTATQEEVFKETQPLVRSVMDGYNVCIFAYGQTGSGKTHTMRKNFPIDTSILAQSGSSGGSTAEKGINYLALNDLFQLSNERKYIMKYEMHMQMVEIYNEQVRDLLAEDSSITKLEIQGCSSDNEFALQNASMHHVVSITDVINLMKLGDINRAVASAAINDRRSRSHSVLTVHVCGEDVSGTTLNSCLHLVDLAGSERVDEAGATGEGLREAQHINKSLSCLQDVIMALAQKNSYIPYRNSKLTLLLQNALGGRAKTLMFAHVSPEGDSFGETISTLKFAQKVSTVELGAASKNKESNEVLELKAELESLRAALANKGRKTPMRNKPKEVVRTPHEKPKLMMEKTPPRTRRLSIENCSAMKVEKMNADERKGPKTPFMQTKSRRLSLEGSRYANKTPEQMKILDSSSKPVMQLQDGDRVLKTPNGSSKVESNGPRPSRSPIPFKSSMEKTGIRTRNLHLHDGEPVKTPLNGGSLADLNQPRPQRSPTEKSSMQKTENRTKHLQLHQLKTPEPAVTSKNIGDKGIKSEQHGITSEFPTPSLANNGKHGKGSQIRKSIRSIGKLINGEKRNQHKLTEVVPATPVKGSGSTHHDHHEAKTPISTNARALRRQSLAGILPQERSRRSSLGGEDIINSRNSKTPPPTRASTKLAKRWL